MKALLLARKMLRRDWRSGELRILVAALIVAVAAVTAINLFTDRFGRLLARESVELVGGDVVVQSTREPNPQWLQQGQQLDMTSARLTEFATVVVIGDELLLTNVKAVTDSYPLRGELRIAEQPYGDEQIVRHPPPPGAVWVDVRVLSRLQVKVGDRISLGATELRIDKVLTYESDRGGNLFSLNPRVLMNAADLAAADVIKPGSRITYKYLFAGDKAEQLRAQLAPQMGPGHRLLELQGANSANSRSANVSSRAEEYLGLTALLAIFLAAIAIAMAARRYSERHFDVSGLLRCLGVQQHQLTRLYLWQLLILALLAASLGTVLGWLAQLGLLAAVQSLLPARLPAAGIGPYFTGFGTAILLMLGVALPPILRLKSVPPLRVFRRELAPLPASGWLVYGVALAAISGLLLMLFDRIGTILLILLAAALAIGLSGALLFAVLKLLRRSMMSMTTILVKSTAAKKQRTQFQPAQLLMRSLRNLAGHTGTTTGQILSFGLTAMIMVILLLLRTDLVNQWQAQIPDDAPNNFVFNIQPFERDAFEKKLLAANINARLYAIVRGRLLWEKQPPGSKGAREVEGTAPNRELNFTWLEQLPANNKVVNGQWRSQSPAPEVSIEQGLAERLGIEVGDELSFDIAGKPITATVNSLRSVEWRSFSPNFYVIFQPGALEQFSSYYLTSFRLSETQKPFLAELLKEFPSVSLIEVDVIIEQLKSTIEQVTLMVEMMLLFVLLAGVMVLLASIQTTLDERLREGALMRAFGASRRYLRSATLAEFILLGWLAGLFAALGTELACSALYQRIFNMDYQSGMALWLLLPASLALMTGSAGYLSTRKVLQVSPRELLS